ncbi:RCC1 domain-containing protein [Pseudomonas japonica]|uniref:RCC1 domain-containing protein n=1 Tax=Pseudomonas japonica TaxID=256466 RepID=UPI0038004664
MTIEARTAPSDTLDPLLIPGLIVPVYTPGADGGVNYHMIHVNVLGLPVFVQAYLNMREGDWVKVFWGDPGIPVASGMVYAEDVDQDFGLFIRAEFIPEGISAVHCVVTRAGSGNEDASQPLNILVRTEAPGGTDPEPDLPGHQRLPPPDPELPASGIIDEEAAKNGVKVTIGAYPNMREFDVITFSWGGELLQHSVTQAEVDAGSLDILVTEQTILAAGDSDELVLVYRVHDEVQNPSSEWSPRTLVMVEVGTGLFAAPLIKNPDLEADPFDVIDLEVLGDADLEVEVYAAKGGDLLIGDVVALTWIGTTAQGEAIPVSPPELTVLRLPISLVFYIPNASLLPLGRGRGVASYRVTREEMPAGVSKRSFVTFLGEEQRLPRPTVSEAVDGVLDPTLVEATAVVPGDALEAGDTLILTWLGTRANGTPLHRAISRSISGGNAGRPQSIPIAGAELIAPLDGGSVSLYYSVEKRSGLILESDREELSVGQARGELPPPFTRPAPVDGVLDPDSLPTQLQIVVPPWPGMHDEQILHVRWQASSGPHYDDFMPISPALVGEEVVFYLPREHVEANLGADIEISYRVEDTEGPDQFSAVATLRIGARPTPLPLPRILEAEGDQLNPGDVTQGASAYIDASARLEDGDLITLHIVSPAEDGSLDIPFEVEDGDGGEAATITVPYATIVASIGTRISVHYSISRAAGGPVEQSGMVSYTVHSELGHGPLRIMGARFYAGAWLHGRVPRMLSALHAQTLAPLLAEWRYEGDSQWATGTTWIDHKPWLKLHVRSTSQTWECRPVNVFGNGYANATPAAFVVMRDEVMGADGPEVDMIAWGNGPNGGHLRPEVANLTDVQEVAATAYAFAARLRSGNVACWGSVDSGSQSPIIEGDYIQVRGNLQAFAGLRRNGELFAWGADDACVPVPPPVMQYHDYVDLYGTAVAFAARRASGHVVAWGEPGFGGRLKPGQDQYADIVDVASTVGAFAALRDSGTGRCVIAWGDSVNGGDAPDDITHLDNVRRLFATAAAFCILLDSGAVKAWPHTVASGDIPQPITVLSNIVEVSATWNAFCARLSNGRVVAWGEDDWGADLSPEAGDASNVIQVSATSAAFAALCRDGTVIAWGDPIRGGDTSAVADKLVDVRAIYGNAQAFTALTGTGEVVTWGERFNGGDSSLVQSELAGKVTTGRLLPADEARAVAEPNLRPESNG